MTLQFPQAPLLFNEGSHSYFCNGQKLKSVTTLLRETLFADKYSDVDPEVLAKAAEFGTAVHRGLEAIALVRITGEEKAFEADSLQHSVIGKAVSLLDANGVQPLQTEYLVTDSTSLAGSIDLIADVAGEASIVDYKFTYNLDTEYLSWQESIYAYLFEKMTGQHISKLYAIWVPKRDITLGQFVELPRKTDEQIIALISGTLTTINDALPSVITDMQNAIADVLIEEKQAAERKKMLQERLLSLMEQHGIKSWKNDLFDVTYVAPVTKKSLDTKALLAAHPEINQDEFSKESLTKSQIRFKLK